MVVLTAKVDFKKIMLILGAAAVVLLALILFFGGSEQTFGSQDVSGNDRRVAFLKNFGWEVVSSPKESGQVLIPAQTNDVFDRYNALQKGQGYDLSKFSGRKVMRYVYEITNYPGAEAPVYATLLVYKNKVIGGDVTDTSAKGKIRGFQMPPAVPSPTVPQATQPVQD